MGQETPEYAAQPINRFLEYWKDSRQLLDLSIEGVNNQKFMLEIYEKVQSEKTISLPEEAFAELIKQTRAKLSFFDTEMLAGFPLLHAHTLVGAWGALEAAIEDMAVALLINEPKHLQMAAFAKIRIPLAEYEALDKEDRMRLLVEELDRGISLGRKNGADTFENLLEVFLLSGPLNADVRKTLWEVNHVRNVIVHRNSFADRRLVKSCPWLNLKVGDKVTVTHEDIDRYGNALCDYARTILRRLKARYAQQELDLLQNASIEEA
jgi:hypothetical protein